MLRRAERIHVTTRTPRRRLAESGLSFREDHRDLLRSRVENKLRDDRLPIAEIAYLSGYAEPSTFHYAFSSWTGVTPGKWGERQPRASQLKAVAPCVRIVSIAAGLFQLLLRRV